VGRDTRGGDGDKPKSLTRRGLEEPTKRKRTCQGWGGKKREARAPHDPEGLLIARMARGKVEKPHGRVVKKKKMKGNKEEGKNPLGGGVKGRREGEVRPPGKITKSPCTGTTPQGLSGATNGYQGGRRKKEGQEEGNTRCKKNGKITTSSGGRKKTTRAADTLTLNSHCLQRGGGKKGRPTLFRLSPENADEKVNSGEHKKGRGGRTKNVKGKQRGGDKNQNPETLQVQLSKKKSSPDEPRHVPRD